jgi:hypothetical protein
MSIRLRMGRTPSKLGSKESTSFSMGFGKSATLSRWTLRALLKLKIEKPLGGKNRSSEGVLGLTITSYRYDLCLTGTGMPKTAPDERCKLLIIH